MLHWVFARNRFRLATRTVYHFHTQDLYTISMPRVYRLTYGQARLSFTQLVSSSKATFEACRGILKVCRGKTYCITFLQLLLQHHLET